MKLSIRFWVTLSACTLAACTVTPAGPDLDALTAAVMRSSFHDQGVAKIDRLQQDEANRECSAAAVAGVALDEKSAAAIQTASLKSVPPPSDGKYLGDWKEGEKIAQSGRGLTWTDSASEPNGGNCYNCHQIGKAELSFGTLGPSLYQYGKLRGVSDPSSPQARVMVEYTWGKIWNARATNACSSMPRFGHNKILTEQQIKHVMALLLDPKSDINQ
jgi:L-cysteine S-thiosulfotransferase